VAQTPICAYILLKEKLPSSLFENQLSLIPKLSHPKVTKEMQLTNLRAVQPEKYFHSVTNFQSK
jgi:hypothetical protein